MAESSKKGETERSFEAAAEHMDDLKRNYGIGETENFSERLRAELRDLQEKNVQSFLESRPLIDEVLKQLQSATDCVDEMQTRLYNYLGVISLMKTDIELIATCHDKLETRWENIDTLSKELDQLLIRLVIPPELKECLSSFDEARMPQNLEACKWLESALQEDLEAPQLDDCYTNMKWVRVKRIELDNLRKTFVEMASQFMRNYFKSLEHVMITVELQGKCQRYACLLQHLKSLDKNCLGPLRKDYCSFRNPLLQREIRESVEKLRSSKEALRKPNVWRDGPMGSSQSANTTDTSALSESYEQMLRILLDESSFLARFMCFEFPALDPSGSLATDDDDELEIMDIDVKDTTGKRSADLEVWDESLGNLLDGIKKDIIGAVDLAYEIDPLCCISMHRITECYIRRYVSVQEARAADFVRRLLGDLEEKISEQFHRFVGEACNLIERNAPQEGILSYISRFTAFAPYMEQYSQGQSRDLVNQAYTKFVSFMSTTLVGIAQGDKKYALENYSALKNSVCGLARVEARVRDQANEWYEQACSRFTSEIIDLQFEGLFQFSRRIEDLMTTIAPEKIPLQQGLSNLDLQNVLNSTLPSVEKSIIEMHTKLQNDLTSKELVDSVWNKYQVLLHNYEKFAELVREIYPTENIISVSKLRGLLSHN